MGLPLLARAPTGVALKADGRACAEATAFPYRTEGQDEPWVLDMKLSHARLEDDQRQRTR